MQENRYYVYTHTRSKDGIVFYVGKGTGVRAYSRDSSQTWRDFIGDDLYNIAIVAMDLSNNEAIELEQQMIENPEENWQLVNRNKSVPFKELDYELFNEWFYYDDTSPTFLKWKKTASNNNHPKFGKKDCPAGYHTVKSRYTIVKLKGKIYKVHRIILTLHGIEIPDGYVVNHKDCNSTNNCIDNLEVVTQQINAQLKRDFVHNIPQGSSPNVGIRIIERYNKIYVTARYVNAEGNRITKTLSTFNRDDVDVFVSELSEWRKNSINEKVEILRNKSGEKNDST